MLSPAGPVRIMYRPSDKPNCACTVHCVGSSLSASTPMLQPWLRRAYIPLRGTMSLPIRVAAVTEAAPSRPGVPVAKPAITATGATLVVPALATTSWLGPRCGPRPRLIAFASAAQNAAPAPAMLSYTSGGRPGRPSVSRHEPALLPVPSTTEIWLPRLPVYSAVMLKPVPGSVRLAAVSVPSVTRTQRKLLAPCCTAVATGVPMS